MQGVTSIFWCPCVPKMALWFEFWQKEGEKVKSENRTWEVKGKRQNQHPKALIQLKDFQPAAVPKYCPDPSQDQCPTG